MAEPRKVFRIEETAAALFTHRVDGTQSLPPRYPSAAIGAMAPTRLVQDSDEGNRDEGHATPAEAKHLARIGHELDAVVTGAAQATLVILAAAEEIDRIANKLSASLTGRTEEDLAQNIGDLVIRIFEACNFQDLVGQRVTKVTATLAFVEDRIGRMLEETASAVPARECGEAGQELHGPRLDIDRGHVSQDDVDAIFSGN
jgi:chemotaxis protein CheZ